MELKDIIELIDKFDNSGVVALDLELGDAKISLKKAEGVKPCERLWRSVRKYIQKTV